MPRLNVGAHIIRALKMERDAAIAERDAAYAQLREWWGQMNECVCGAFDEKVYEGFEHLEYSHAPDCPTTKALAQDSADG